MKGQPGSSRPTAVGNVRGQLLGYEVKTKAALQTSAKPLGPQVEALLAPLQQGRSGKTYVSPALLAAWPEIVGERLAGLCLPVQMKAQPKSRSRHKKAGDDGAVLEVRADPAIQIDLDYGQALLVERINGFFGYHAVSRLKVLAKPMPSVGRQSTAQAEKPSPPSQEAEAQARTQVAQVPDDGLRHALEKLGAHVLCDKKNL